MPAESQVKIANSAGNHKIELYKSVEYIPTLRASLRSNLDITSFANCLMSIKGMFIRAMLLNIQNIIVPIIRGIT